MEDGTGEAEVEAGGARLRARVFVALFAAVIILRGFLAENPLFSLSGIALLLPPARRWAALFALGLYVLPGLGLLARAPFAAPNHLYLEAVVLLLIAIEPARDAAGRALSARALTALAVAVVFISGVQKTVHGTYPRGEYFAMTYAESADKFAPILDRLTTDAEREEAVAFRKAFRDFLREGREGLLDRAPPRPAIVELVSRLGCWSTLAVELLVPWLLLARRGRIRRIGAGVLLGFFVCVEAAAREWMFGSLVLCLLAPILVDGDDRPADPAAPALPRAGSPRRRTALALGAVLAVVWSWPVAHMYLALAHDLSPWKLGGLGMYTMPVRQGAIVVETREAGRADFRRHLPRSVAEANAYERAGFELRNVPFATSAARSLVLRLRAAARPVAPLDAVRIRVTTIRWDRELGRYRATARTWTYE